MATTGVRLLTYMGLIFIVSSIPENVESGYWLDTVSPRVQNLLHVLVYGPLAVLWVRMLGACRLPERGTMLVAVALTAGYGGLIELYQSRVPGRVPSIWDFIGDAAGALVFVYLYWMARSKGAFQSPRGIRVL